MTNLSVSDIAVQSRSQFAPRLTPSPGFTPCRVTYGSRRLRKGWAAPFPPLRHGAPLLRPFPAVTSSSATPGSTKASAVPSTGAASSKPIFPFLDLFDDSVDTLTDLTAFDLLRRNIGAQFVNLLFAFRQFLSNLAFSARNSEKRTNSFSTNCSIDEARCPGPCHSLLVYWLSWRCLADPFHNSSHQTAKASSGICFCLPSQPEYTMRRAHCNLNQIRE